MTHYVGHGDGKRESCPIGNDVQIGANLCGTVAMSNLITDCGPERL